MPVTSVGDRQSTCVNVGNDATTLSASATVLLMTAAQPPDLIFTPSALSTLRERFDVIELDDDSPGGRFDQLLPEAFAVVGQPALPVERLRRATRLRALLNIEGNFFPNVDYETCFREGIHVLGCGPAYADAVAEYSLGLALDLARGISREDRAFRAGTEHYLGAAAADAIHLRGSEIGLIGYGNLGRALHRLIVPFGATVRIYDPWLPSSVIEQAGALCAPLPDLLQASGIVFVLATTTAESRELLDRSAVSQLRAGARLILVSRAAVFDLDAVLDRVTAGDLLAAIDVWPEEPMPVSHRARSLDGLVLSAHRAGATPAALTSIGDMVLDDLTLIRRGLPPVTMQGAARELVGRYQNRPAT
jgi:phosphoglycerate dehydrogenase-like enzyme